MSRKLEVILDMCLSSVKTYILPIIQEMPDPTSGVSSHKTVYLGLGYMSFTVTLNKCATTPQCQFWCPSTVIILRASAAKTTRAMLAIWLVYRQSWWPPAGPGGVGSRSRRGKSPGTWIGRVHRGRRSEAKERRGKRAHIETSRGAKRRYSLIKYPIMKLFGQFWPVLSKQLTFCKVLMLLLPT